MFPRTICWRRTTWFFDGVEFQAKADSSKREEAFVQGRTLHLLERYLTIEQVLDLEASYGTVRVKDLTLSKNGRC